MDFNRHNKQSVSIQTNSRGGQGLLISRGLKVTIMALFFVVSLSVLSLRVYAAPPLLVDEQDLLTDAQEAELLDKLEIVSDKTNTDVIIYIPQSLNGQDVAQFSYDYVAQNNYGRGNTLSAVILVICRDGNYIDYSVAGTGTAQKKLFGSDDKAADIEEKVITRLRDYKENGFSGDGIYLACMRYVEGVEHDMQGFFARLGGVIKEYNFILVFAGFLIAFIISWIYMRIQRGKLISIRNQTTANDYIEGSVNLHISRDRFINQTVTRSKIDTERRSGGGSSMSSGSSGGRSFSSHSGRV